MADFSQQEEEQQSTAGLVDRLSSSNLDFGLDLYHKFSSSDNDKDIFFSPLSISATLGMVLVGSRGNSYKQITESLHLTSFPVESQILAAYESAMSSLQIESEAITLRAANRMFIQKSFLLLEEFYLSVKKSFKSEVDSLDFSDSQASCSEINEWVEEVTNSKIKDLLSPNMINALTRLVLVNAVYFKGDWLKQFNQSLTKRANFQCNPSKNVQVHMMEQKSKFNYLESQELDCQVLELPYNENRLSLFIILPKKIDGLKDLEPKLNVETIRLLTMDVQEQTVTVQLPKFRIEDSYQLNEVLISLGMSDLFSADAADLSGVTGSRDLYVSTVVHKAFIEVNEEGSEAAAATSGIMTLRMYVPPDDVAFIADHPFLFLIRDNESGLVLFMGSLKNPGSVHKDEL